MSHLQVLVPIDSLDYGWGNKGNFFLQIMDKEKPSTTEQKHIEQLEKLGFEWNLDYKERWHLRWLARYEELVEFKKIHGHCNVPYGHFNEFERDKNKQIRTWVDWQRKAYKDKMERQPSSITEERIEQLDKIGRYSDLE